MSNQLSLPRKMVCWAIGSAILFTIVDAPKGVMIGSLAVVFCLGLLRHLFDKYSTVEKPENDLSIREQARLLRNRPGTMTQAGAPRMAKGKKHTYNVVPFDPTRHK
jgi:hypothetical protein